ATQEGVEAGRRPGFHGRVTCVGGAEDSRASAPEGMAAPERAEALNGIAEPHFRRAAFLAGIFLAAGFFTATFLMGAFFAAAFLAGALADFFAADLVAGLGTVVCGRL